MNIRHSRNSRSYYLKRLLRKKNTWICLFLHIVILVFLFAMSRSWLFNGEWEHTRGSLISKYVGPAVNNTNDFFGLVLPNLILMPFLVWTFIISPLSWLFWGGIDEIAQKTEKDGTDLFFLSTEIPTNRSKIFSGKIFFLTTSLTVLYWLLFALPFTLLLWKVNWFSNLTGIQLLLFLGWNFLITPLFILVPFVILLFSLASLRSVWYIFLKYFGRFSMLIYLLFLMIIHQRGELAKKMLEWWENLRDWQKEHYLLTILAIIGITVALALFTVQLAAKKFQKKDLS